MAKNELKARDYVHLHNHTQYSLLDGLSKIPKLMEYVKKSGMESIAITDHGTLSGVIEFYTESEASAIRPIIGMETYVATRTMMDKEPGKDKANYHLILLAMNNQGYKNLMALSSIANLKGFYYRPRIDHVLLEKYHEGLIVLSGCIGSEIGENLRSGQYEQAKEVAQWYKRIFGDRYYFEVQDHGHPKHPTHWQPQEDVNKLIFKLSDELDIPCVVTCDAHYLLPDDQIAHEILLCVQTGSFLSDQSRMSMGELELHVTEPKQIIARWGAERPEVITNTRKIAERCNVSIELDKILIPKFDLPNGEKQESYLQKLVYRGLAWRYGGVSEKKASKLSIAEAKKSLPSKVAERAIYELSVIDQMHFNDYFLIIADFINWGKNEGIVFGPGRGSAAGSIIAYALKITELDPLAYDLLFERFLNPDRISMPDIDIDIQDTRRDEVIEYCIQKYGTDRVANIVTFGRMAARNAVRDVARVLEVPYAEADRLAKMLPPPVQGRHIPLAESLKNNSELKAEYASNETSKKVLDLAVQLEGTIRSHGVHAAGVVIAPENVVNFAPLEMAQKGVVATQYSMGPIEHLGLLKIDFLGLSNLTIIKDAISIIKKVYDDDIDITKIPLDDKPTFELLARGDTTGVFQLESAGMKRYLKQLVPTVFEDITAMVALYRPGPMQFVDEFIARKNGLKKIEYFHPKMEGSLQNTYGVLLYQEQVMQISKDLCGFTGGQADTLRKGIAKKIPSVLAKMKIDFIEGAITHSQADRKTMEKFWGQLEDFAAYCFNKSHAACYALIAYQTAYLKAHYPAAFMAAVMTSDFDNIDRLAIEIAECQRMGIAVLPPDVNESFANFAVMLGDQLTIRFGMSAIKNVGSGAVEEIVKARAGGKPFSTLEDFLGKVNVRIVNRKALESLIKAGAFDRFGDRSSLLHNLDAIIGYANRVQKQANDGQTDLFGNISDESVPRFHLALEKAAIVYTDREQLTWERELLGIYLSQHPLKDYEAYLTANVTSISQLSGKKENASVTVGGVITNIREIMTKNGRKMAFIKLEDSSGEVEVVIFPNSFKSYANILQRDHIIKLKGKPSKRGNNGNQSDSTSLIADSLEEISIDQARSFKATIKSPLIAEALVSLTEIIDQSETQTKQATPLVAKRIYIRLASGEDQQTLESLKTAIDASHGETEVVLVLGGATNKQIIKLPSRIDDDHETMSRLVAVVGQDNVKIK